MIYSTAAIYYLTKFDFYQTFFQDLDKRIMEYTRNGYEEADYSYNTNGYLWDLHPNVRHVIYSSHIVERTEETMTYKNETAKIYNTWYRYKN